MKTLQLLLISSLMVVGSLALAPPANALTGDKWCRIGQFIVSETYKGGGKFQKDDQANFQTERFINCK